MYIRFVSILFFVCFAPVSYLLAIQDYKLCSFEKASSCFIEAEHANEAFLVASSFSPIQKTKYSFLLLHGLSDSPYYYKDFVKMLAPLGYNIIAPRNSRHGTSVKDLNQVKYQEWIQDSEDAYEHAKILGEKVIVVGFSTGAPLALYLHETQKDLAGLFFLAPAIHYDGWIGKVSCLVSWWPWVIKGAKKEHGKVGAVRYQSIPLGGVCQLYKMTGMIHDRFNPQIKVPTFMYASVNDTVTDQIAATHWLKNRVGTSEELALKTSGQASAKSRLLKLILQGDISKVEEPGETIDVTMFATDYEVAHSGVMLETQGFGGESEHNLLYDKMRVEFLEFFEENFE